MRRRSAAARIAACALAWPFVAIAQQDAGDAGARGDPAPFSFAIVSTDTGPDADRDTPSMLRAIGDGPARFVVHFERGPTSAASCGDAALERRRAALDASAKPVVPVPGTSEWADCGAVNVDAVERLQRVNDTLFGGDQSLGRAPLPWVRQSAMSRFRRNRENLRWQSGPVLFATVNVPDNNNGFRFAAGRNGEFEERLIANRTWIERTFRLATERKLSGVVLFVDAAPRFSEPLRAPDLRARDRDGYYEWKVALRDAIAAFKGRVLLVQGRRLQPPPDPDAPDHPLRDAAGRPLERVARIAALAPDGAPRWLRIDVDPADPALFRVSTERLFDDPTGELYGPARVR